MAEGVGFEPTVRLDRTTAFEAAAFNFQPVEDSARTNSGIETSPETAESGAPETALDDPAVSALAAALRGLTAEQRAALARAGISRKVETHGPSR